MLRTLLISTIVLGFAATGFYLGRLSAPAPRFVVQAGDDLSAAFEDFQRGQSDTLALMQQHPLFKDPLMKGEASSDGTYYFVVSAKDPGILNWLDTESHQSGLIMMRWQGLDGDLPESQAPSAWKIPLAEISQHLPPDTRYISPLERRTHIAARRMAVQRRDAG